MKYIFTLLMLVLCSIIGYAQISISSPINRAVYQRSLSNLAELTISGNYNYDIVTSVQARLIDPTTGTEISGFGWRIITKNPSGGYFQGTLSNVPGGWYTLEVRALKSGAILGTTSLSRVGIGEVFMIAGQSNAHGFHNWTPPDYMMLGLGSTDERVVSQDMEIYCKDVPIPFPTFTQILDQTKIGNAGRAAWYWGKLGQEIVDSLQVPVAFFNTAASGSSTQNWVESSNGLSTINPITGLPFCSSDEEHGTAAYDTVGMPYANFKRGLNLYNSLFGARSVLWHQGESDNISGVSASTYQSNLTYIINKSRSDFASNLSWMVARASFAENTENVNIINGQNNTISPSNKIFYGPATDWLNNFTYANSRDWINLHFTKNIGFPYVIDGWRYFILGSGFINDAVPIEANTAPLVTVTVNSLNETVMTVPSGYSAYKWIRTDLTGNNDYEGTSAVGTSNSLNASSGTYQCWVVTSNGNLQISSPVVAENMISLTTNGSSCGADTFLSDMKYYKATNGEGPVEINKTNGSLADGDGSSILLKGANYSKGIGVKGNSEIEYILPTGSYYKFKASIGIGDDVSASCGTSSGVVFKLIADGITIYTSPTITRSSAVVNVDVNIYNKKRLILKTIEVSSSDCNKAVWANARLKCAFNDTTPPSTPTNLAVNQTLTKCMSFTWTASTDNLEVGGYDILKNGVVVATLPANATYYQLTGLTDGETGTFGVRAFDGVGNQSAVASVSYTTATLALAYLAPNPLCTSQTYTPITNTPTGGVFSLTSGTGGILNTSTGQFSSNVVANNYAVTYTIGSGISACEDLITVNLETVSQPTPPTIAVNAPVVNQGATVTLSASTCSSSNLVWNFTSANSNPINDSPTVTTIYSASCVIGSCTSSLSSTTVKVIPNCNSNFNLVKPTDNLSSSPTPVKFNASGYIRANNSISNTNKVEYNSATSITLNPGFSTENGVVFKAEIKNCP